MVKIVGIKFKDAGKLYYFSPGGHKVKLGDNVIVETARGLEFGKVALSETEVNESEIVAPLKKQSQTDLKIIHQFHKFVLTLISRVFVSFKFRY